MVCTGPWHLKSSRLIQSRKLRHVAWWWEETNSFTQLHETLAFLELSELSELSTCSFCKLARPWNPSLCWGTGDWKCGLGKEPQNALAAIQRSMWSWRNLIHYDDVQKTSASQEETQRLERESRSLACLTAIAAASSFWRSKPFLRKIWRWQVNRSHDLEMMWKWCGNDEQSGLKIGFSELLLGRKAIPIAILTHGRTMIHLHLREVGPDRASETSSLVLVATRTCHVVFLQNLAMSLNLEVLLSVCLDKTFSFWGCKRYISSKWNDFNLPHLSWCKLERMCRHQGLSLNPRLPV